MKFNYLNTDLAELGHQLTLSPRHLRPRQIDGIERALDLCDPRRDYPYDWVCFHITGRRPYRQNQRSNVSGKELTNDLPTLAEQITRRGAPQLSDLPGEYCTHEALSAELDVSTKTVRRWRRRGLMGVRATCDDGVSRLVFSRRAIDRFKKRNKKVVQRGASFKLLTDAEKDHIVELARELLAQ